MKLTRRDMVKLGLLSAGALAVPLRLFESRVQAGCGPFSTPLRIPPVLKPMINPNFPNSDYYEITMMEADVPILCDGRLTRVWGYDGIYPGPTINATSRRPVVIRQINNLSVDTSVHLHGGHTPPDSDGHPRDAIAPGGASKIYTYPNNQDGATLWYHDHIDMATGRNVYMGLAGMYVLDDGTNSQLPEAIPLIIQDRNFDAGGQLVYDHSGPTGEFFGQTPVVNGVAQPFLQVGTAKTRFRILNGSNARIYRLTLTGPAPVPHFLQLGTDGGFLQQAQDKTVIVLAPAERVDVVINFANHLNDSFILTNSGVDAGGTAQIMRFDVTQDVPDAVVIPPMLRDIQLLDPTAAGPPRPFDLQFINNVWTINGRIFDPQQPVLVQPRLNTVEIWTFTNVQDNPPAIPHPMHIHDVMFQVLSINDVPLSDAQRRDIGWKDTFLVSPFGTTQYKVSVIMQFTDNLAQDKQRYVFHCHKLEHEDMAMMDEFNVLP